MKLLFVHDATFKRDAATGRYYGISVNNASLERYKYIADDITVMIRTRPFEPGEPKSRYTEVAPEYKVVHVDNYMSVRGWLFYRRELRKRLRGIIAGMDIVVCRFAGETAKMAAEICRETGKPYIVECVGCPWDSLWNYSWKGKVIAPYIMLRQKRLIKRAPYVIYVTNRFLQRRYPTIGKAIAASNVELLPMEESVLEKRLEKIARGVPKVIKLGTLSMIDVPYKGHAYVMEAMAILKKEGYKFEYQIAGGGSSAYLAGKAKAFGVEDSVVFTGTLPHKDVFKWVDGIDLYIQPSDQEGLPRALIEAMSRACPAIGSTTAGIPELLPDEAVFTRKKVGELVKALRRMTDSKERLARHAERNYATALEYQRDVLRQRRNDFFDMVMREQGLK